MEAVSRRSLGLRPMANSMGVLPLQSPVCLSRLLPCASIGQEFFVPEWFVQFFGGCIYECQEKLLEQSYTHPSSVWTWCMGSCWKSLHIVHSIECLHVMRLVEGHLRKNRLRVHLESVRPLVKLAPSKTMRNPKALSPIFADPWSRKMRSPNSSARSPLTREGMS